MTSDRSTVRPVNIARLVEVVDLCETSAKTAGEIADTLGASGRRAEEVLAEAARIGLLSHPREETKAYATTELGEEFLRAIRDEDWRAVSAILSEHSPHYADLRRMLIEAGSATKESLINQLNSAESIEYRYNETGIDVVCDWAERLGDFQRNAFTGKYYVVERREQVGSKFGEMLMEEYRSMEETVGLDVRQHYVSIPRLRERLCERIRCTRDVFDDALVGLVEQNIGKLELTGAPRDTTAKESVLGLKSIETTETEEVVTTTQSTERVLDGVEYRDKQYYYLADHHPDQRLSLRDTEVKP